MTDVVHEPAEPLGLAPNMELVEEAEVAPEEQFQLSPAIVVISDPMGPQAEAIRALRTHLVAQHIREGRRGLTITSASSGVGCTFVATNLAVALSQIGLKVLLIDGDLRQPSVDAEIMPPKNVPGLQQYLASPDRSARDCIQDEVLPGLSIMYSGGPAANPQELLAGNAFNALVDGCMRDFDFTIIDTPAANSCADARRISTVVGYSLIVARRDKSYVKDVATLAAELRADRANVIGSVLNEF